MALLRTAETRADAQPAKYRSHSSCSSGGRSSDNGPYVDLIQRDPAVCDTCFQLRYDILTAEYWRRSLGWSDYEHWVPRGDANVPVPGDAPTDGTRYACDHCGTRRNKDRPLPTDEIEECALHLSETLSVKKIPHDRDVLLNEVRDRNTSANQCRQDSHVFAPAVKAAIDAC